MVPRPTAARQTDQARLLARARVEGVAKAVAEEREAERKDGYRG
jgi:hypothetical protein